MTFLKFLISMLAFGLLNCQSYKEQYYSFQEANLIILSAFAIKDSQCSSSHRLTTFLPGDARKTDVDNCEQAIYYIDCGSWSANDPTPLQCKTISYKVK